VRCQENIVTTPIQFDEPFVVAHLLHGRPAAVQRP
jgi:hypothetical protein